MESLEQEWFKPELVVDKVVNFIRESIAVGKLIPGQKINEKDFTSNFGFSRSPLREALRILDTEGLVNIVPHKGAFIREVSEKDVKEIFEMRILIELYAIKKAWENKSPEIIGELRKIIDNQTIHTENNNFPEIVRYSNEFHDRLMRMSKNDILFQMYTNLIKPIRFILFLVYQNRKNARNSIEEHYKLLQAFDSEEPSCIQKLFKEHIEWGYSISIEILTQLGGTMKSLRTT